MGYYDRGAIKFIIVHKKKNRFISDFKYLNNNYRWNDIYTIMVLTFSNVIISVNLQIVQKYIFLLLFHRHYLQDTQFTSFQVQRELILHFLLHYYSVADYTKLRKQLDCILMTPSYQVQVQIQTQREIRLNCKNHIQLVSNDSPK